MSSTVNVPKWFPIVWAVGGALLGGASYAGAHAVSFAGMQAQLAKQPEIDHSQDSEVARMSRDLEVLKSQFENIKNSLGDLKSDTKYIRERLLEKDGN